MWYARFYTGSVYIETNNYYVTVDMNKRFPYVLICKNRQYIFYYYVNMYYM